KLRVEGVRQLRAERLGRQPKESRLGVEAVGPAVLLAHERTKLIAGKGAVVILRVGESHRLDPHRVITAARAQHAHWAGPEGPAKHCVRLRQCDVDCSHAVSGSCANAQGRRRTRAVRTPRDAGGRGDPEYSESDSPDGSRNDVTARALYC